MSHIKNFLLVALSITLALVSGCGEQTQKATDQPTPKEVQLTEQGGACGSGVGLNAGDTLVLILDRDPSSVYKWEVGFYVPQVIAPENDAVDQSDSNLDSTSSAQTLRFLAIDEGQATLVMNYQNPLDKDDPDLKTCEVTVDVK